jgi:hypothetical protein
VPEKACARFTSRRRRSCTRQYQCRLCQSSVRVCGGPGGDGSADHLPLTLHVADHNARRLSRSATFTDSTTAAGGRADRRVRARFSTDTFAWLAAWSALVMAQREQDDRIFMQRPCRGEDPHLPPTGSSESSSLIVLKSRIRNQIVPEGAGVQRRRRWSLFSGWPTALTRVCGRGGARASGGPMLLW